jgi:hypothetical protein
VKTNATDVLEDVSGEERIGAVVDDERATNTF